MRWTQQRQPARALLTPWRAGGRQDGQHQHGHRREDRPGDDIIGLVDGAGEVLDVADAEVGELLAHHSGARGVAEDVIRLPGVGEVAAAGRVPLAPRHWQDRWGVLDVRRAGRRHLRVLVVLRGVGGVADVEQHEHAQQQQQQRRADLAQLHAPRRGDHLTTLLLRWAASSRRPRCSYFS